MKRLFIDSSVFYSATYSARGHARDLILMGLMHKVVLVISPLVIEEVRRNLERNAPNVVDVFDYLLELIPFEMSVPTQGEIQAALAYVAGKDAPILAAAQKAGVDLLVSLDKKHILENPLLEKASGLVICTPKEAVELITKTGHE